MNRFLKKIGLNLLLFILLFCIYNGGVLYLKYNHEIDFPAAIIDKYERLESLKKESKVIICGGSSSSYGIDSEMLQTALNKPVINTSLAMSLGSEYHLNITKDYIEKGDVILYIPEYEYYYENESGNKFLYTMVYYYPQIIKDFTMKQKIRLFINGVKLSTNFYLGLFDRKNIPSLQYTRVAYNVYGDNVSLVAEKKSKINKSEKTRYQKLKSKKISKKFISFIKEMKAICKEKGASLLVSFPPIEQSQFDDQFVKDIIKVKKESGVDFIANPESYVYNSNFFYDSSYHLNGEGRVLRTKQLINTLKVELN